MQIVFTCFRVKHWEILILAIWFGNIQASILFFDWEITLMIVKEVASSYKKFF